jgi:ubiquinone/menaquinone biosynthesis C-methylase UbiE
MDERTKTEIVKSWDECLEYEFGIVERLCKSSRGPCRLVEVGAGSSGLLGKKRTRLAELEINALEVDIDRDALAKNTEATHRVCANCYSLPLPDNSVDIVICRWLFEHLENPDDAMKEFGRVLKKGGFLFIKTPNLLNYAIVISKFTPTWFHNLVRSALESDDNIPTYYRANTTRRLKSLGGRYGFANKRL